jgi:hypothetical protein
MSARTCLLCGKPLSRIWVGAGDDFCSREHGNQYRLKRGMDRLTETNKISSLMRRRENPMPIVSASLPLDSASSNRDFPEMRISAAGRTRLPSLPPLLGSSTPRISPVSDSYMRPRVPRQAGSAEPQQPDSSLLRFSARKTAPVVPVRRTELPVRIPRAQAAMLRDRVLGAGSEHRGFGALRHTAIREHSGLGGIAPSCIKPPSAACFLNNRRPRKIKASPRNASVQGLSRGFGFRRPARRRAICVWPMKPRVAMVPRLSPARQMPCVRNTLNRPASPRSMGRRSSTRELVFPRFSARSNPTGIQWPGAVRIGRRSFHNGHALAVRDWGPLWNLSGMAGLVNPRNSLAALVERGMPTPCVVAVPLAPVRANGAHHIALAPFNPSNSPFGYKEYQEK